MKFQIPEDLDEAEFGYKVREWIFGLNKNPGIWQLSLNKPKRTNKQNNALHKYCAILAEELNNAGHPFTFRPFKKELITAWNGDLVKDHIWRPIQRSMLDKESTTSLKTSEINKIHDCISQYLEEEFEIFIPFPSTE